MIYLTSLWGVEPLLGSEIVSIALARMQGSIRTGYLTVKGVPTRVSSPRFALPP